MNFLQAILDAILSLFGVSGPSPKIGGGTVVPPPTPAPGPVIPVPRSLTQPTAPPADVLRGIPHHLPPAEIAKVINAASSRYGIPYFLMVRVAFVESSFNPNARNDSDRPPSVGLFGIKSSTAIPLMGWPADQLAAERRLADPAVNADVAGALFYDIRRRRPQAVSDEGLIGMFHLGEGRYLRAVVAGTLDPKGLTDLNDLNSYLVRYHAA
jgi:transglycosylase-like protein with SLT domain